MALTTETNKAYYEGSNKGSYQFIKLADIISNFMISQVGDDKIIKNTKRAEVAYHAQRGIQELNYDTLANIKTQEVELPSSLSLPMPHDYVDYVEMYFINDSGIKYYIHESNLSLEPTAVLQDSAGNYLYDSSGNLLTGAQSITRDRFKTSTSEDISGKDTNINFLEEGYGYNVDYGKRYGLNPAYATKNGFFTINKDNGTISFSSDLKDKLIVITYITDGLNSDTDMEVHKFAEEAIYKCIAYGVMSAKSNIPEYQINRVKKEKRAAIRSAKLRLSKISIPDIIQTMRIKSKQIKK